MVKRILTLRELNLATLARQLLLERVSLPALGALEHLVGLQAQLPNPPYIGLWTRLQSFQHSGLTRIAPSSFCPQVGFEQRFFSMVSWRGHGRSRKDKRWRGL
ncbi:MAG: hypothetical protein NVS4B11_09890 [Ktedonobacteraceae bacterium]